MKNGMMGNIRMMVYRIMNGYAGGGEGGPRKVSAFLVLIPVQAVEHRPSLIQ